VLPCKLTVQSMRHFLVTFKGPFTWYRDDFHSRTSSFHPYGEKIGKLEWRQRRIYYFVSFLFPFWFLDLLAVRISLLLFTFVFKTFTDPGLHKIRHSSLVCRCGFAFSCSFHPHIFLLSVYMTPKRNFVPAQVIPEWVHSGFQSEWNSRSGKTCHSGIM